jgi:hypothetical protein
MESVATPGGQRRGQGERKSVVRERSVEERISREEARWL